MQTAGNSAGGSVGASVAKAGGGFIAGRAAMATPPGWILSLGLAVDYCMERCREREMCFMDWNDPDNPNVLRLPPLPPTNRR